jgi:adenine-specific DNA-methyltransferase
MENKISTIAKKGELPSFFADRLGVLYASSISQEHKKENGQYFTPIEIATLMASFTENNMENIKILDPGCGCSILSCKLIEHIVFKNKKLKSINLVVYEVDLELIPILKRSLNYLVKWGKDQGIIINTTLHNTDFILNNSERFNESESIFANPTDLFDIVICNPPYFKLSSDDLRVKAAKIIVNGHPNIYSIFMALSAKLLKENGELVFITPRSFASGSYFKLFRAYFFKLIDLDKVHLFVSRKDTFGRDKVLQETLIIKGTRRKIPHPFVIISSSSGLKDLKDPYVKRFPKLDIIDLGSTEKILYLPTSDVEESVMGIFKNWKGNLLKYNIKISTGPVVAFRSRDYILDSSEYNAIQIAPLFWLHNVKQMILEWPIEKTGKGQFIDIQEMTLPILIPNKNYILLRRFSSKDDKNRLIAAPYFCNYLKSDYIGVENMVNYIYRPGGNLERNEVIGLCALLNSNLFNTYFSIFNGNVNVSATELREMKFPALDIIKLIGEKIIMKNDFTIEYSNSVINELFIIEEQLV